MTRTFSRLTRITATALVATLPAVSLAQVDTSEWKCESCPFDEGQRADYEAGGGYVSDDAYRYGNGTGHDEKGGHVLLNGEGRYASDGLQARWRFEDLGIDSREVSVSVGRQGRWAVTFDYDELPWRRYDVTQTVYSASSFDSLTLPGGWVSAGQTSGMTQLSSSLTQQNIEIDRTVFGLGARFLPMDGVSMYADYRQQRREGTDIVSGAWFSNANYLPRPVDTVTDEIDLGVRYTGDSFDVSLGWYGSFFSNDSLALTWDNPFGGVAGASQGRQARAPDNSFQQISVSGTWYVGTLDTVVAVVAATGEGEQDEAFLPYTINSTLSAGALPRANLQGQVDTSNFALTLTMRPHERVRIKASYRSDERENDTPQSTWTRVIVDSFAPGPSEVNIPYSYERASIDLSGRVRVLDDLYLLGGYERTELDRDFQEVAEQTEDSSWGKLQWSGLDWLDLSVRGGTARREIDRYDTTVAQSFNQNPLLRKYNLAYRYREFIEANASVTLADTPFSFAATWLTAEDSYSQSQLGLTDSQEDRIAVDLSYAFSDTTSVYLTFGNEAIEAEQLGSASFGAADWLATHDDDFNHVGGGIVLRDLGDKVDVMLDYVHSEGETDIAVDSSRFPALESTLDSLRVSIDYAHSERLDVSFGIRYEAFDTRDWSVDGVAPDTLPTILTLGAQSYDYDVWVVGVGFHYRLGSRQIEFPD